MRKNGALGLVRALLAVLGVVLVLWTARASHESGHLAIVRPSTPERLHVLDRNDERGGSVPTLPAGEVVVGRTPGGGEVFADGGSELVPVVVHVVSGSRTVSYTLVGGP